jgi:methionyl-tRNA formyltransferase
VYKILYLGTPDFAVPTLEALNADPEIEVSLVVSQPDSKHGRKMKLTPSPVKQKALDLGLSVETPDKISEPDYVEKLAAMNFDAVLVLAYGQILKQSLLDILPDKFINIHASLLPRWRGAAPIQRAVMMGDRITGLSFQIMRLKLDSGPIIFEEQFEILENENSLDLAERLSLLSKDMVCRVIKRHIDGLSVPKKQDPALITYAKKIEKSEGLIDWSKTALEIHNQIRGLKWGPGAYTHLDGKRVKVSETYISNEGVAGEGEVLIDEQGRLTVGTGDGLLGISSLQPEGKPPQKIKDFINGYGLTVGQRFS